MKKIKVHVSGSINVPIKDLHGIQGDLKEISQEEFKLLEDTILEDGICFVSHIWKESKTVKGKKTFQWRVIDGHGRLLMYKSLEKRGHEVPAIPCSEIHGKSFEEAKLLVLNSNAKYGKVRELGLKDFLDSLKLKPVILKKYPMPEIDIERFTELHYPKTMDVAGHKRKYGEKELDENIDTTHECPKCGYAWS